MTDCALPADLFDLHGYLVVPGVLSQELVAQLNAAIDAHADSISIRTDEQTLDGSDSIIHGNKAASGFVGTHGRGDFGGFLWDWGEPAGAMFRELIANESRADDQQTTSWSPTDRDLITNWSPTDHKLLTNCSQSDHQVLTS